MEQRSSSVSRSSVAADVIEAAVVYPDAGAGDTYYQMFEVGALSPEGAVLTGGLLLEIGEELLLELRLPDPPLRVRARVVAIVPGELAAMKVAFVELDAEARQRLAQPGRRGA